MNKSVHNVPEHPFTLSPAQTQRRGRGGSARSAETERGQRQRARLSQRQQSNREWQRSPLSVRYAATSPPLCGGEEPRLAKVAPRSGDGVGEAGAQMRCR